MARTADRSSGPSVRRCSGGARRSARATSGRRGLEPVGDDEQVPPARRPPAAPSIVAWAASAPAASRSSTTSSTAASAGRHPGPPAGHRRARLRPVDDVSAPAVGEDRQLRAEPRLADARAARTSRPSARGPRLRASPVPAEPAQLGVAADQRDDRVELRRQRRKPGRRPWRSRDRRRRRPRFHVAGAHADDLHLDVIALERGGLGWIERQAGNLARRGAARPWLARISPGPAAPHRRAARFSAAPR